MDIASSFKHQPQSQVQLPGYTFVEELYQGSRTLVYRAVHTERQHPVVIKVLRRGYPSFTELVRFRNQYTITQNLSMAGIVRPLSLASYGYGYALVTEDVGSVSLAQYAQQQALVLTDVLAIALQLADILHALCQHRVIHKDIQPAHILIHPESQQVHLIDFSIASLLPKETQVLQSLNTLEGTLAYLAPEQTGRMNRGIDYRADYYALGVTLYQLLTGDLPFKVDDALELVHCHMAKVPQPVHQVNPTVPERVSAIVAKLMAKNAEDRYQSALGFKHDLEVCWAQWQSQAAITNFELGQRDVCDRFLIPEKLYGRETEVQTLLNAFERVSQGTAELMLIAGFSGIGKTAVVNEVHKPITRQQGYFIKGKFDQFNRNSPFSAFVQAFRSLMGQLLGEPDAALADWKAKILAAVGESGQVLIEVIPELKCIIGEQPAVPELSGSAAQNRFNLLFGKFIRVFTTPKHPLVIFLDDLQWVDAASLHLFKLLMDDESAYLLVLGAYRDNEVFPAHPLMLALDEIRQQGVMLNTLTLAPLRADDINHLVADSLHCSVALALPLAQLVHQKTQGNPFFATQFLQGLAGDGWITFNTDAGYWQCDLTQVRQLALTDDVVVFMVGRIQKLPEVTQTVLKIAACMGNRFDLAILAVVCEQSQEEVAVNLWRSLQEGLVIPENETYKFFQGARHEINPVDDITVSYRFLHDRVQQAAYSLIPSHQKQATHLHIGRLLWQKLYPEERQNQIFRIVHHYNEAIVVISEEEERKQLLALNITAGQKAHSSAAYQAAWQYYQTALGLLPDESWQQNYSLTLKLYEANAEAAHLTGNFVQMESLIEEVLKHATRLLDCVKVHETKIQAYMAQAQQLPALEIGREFLRLLGIQVPESPRSEDLRMEMVAIDQAMAGKAIADLADLPLMEDEQQLARATILAHLFSPAYQANPSLYPWLVCRLMQLLIEYGNTPRAAHIYACYGMACISVSHDFASAVEYGKLACQLDLSPQTGDGVAGIYVAGGYITHCSSHLKDTLPLLLKSYQNGLEAGNFEYGGYAIVKRSHYSYLTGYDLLRLRQEMAATSHALITLNQGHTLTWSNTFEQVVLNLLGYAEIPWELVGTAYDETQSLPLQTAANDRTGLHYIYQNKLILCYLFDRIPQAIENAPLAESYLDGVVCMVDEYIFNFYDSLVRLAYCTSESMSVQQSLLDKVQANQSIMQRWATNAPMNGQHKYELIEAEKCRVFGKKLEAIELYDKAIAGAQANEYIQEEALANELAAKFYLDWGKEKVAAGYMQEAYYCYARWGAKAKTDDLEQRYSQLLQPILREVEFFNPLETLASIAAPNISIHSSSSSTSSSTSKKNQLDFAAILKAVQIISKKKQIDELLSHLVQLILQNSGADKLVIVLPDRDNFWQVRAIATPETTQLSAEPLTAGSNLPIQLICYVKNTREIIGIDDLNTELPIIDAYLQQHQPRSVLCLPILHQGNLSGLLYLQNQSIVGVFNRDRITILNFLCSQAAISLENAQLYQTLEQRVEERTQALQESQHELTDYIENAATSLHWVDANGIIIWANQTELDFLGYNREEYIGQSIANFHADDEVIADILTRLSNNETLTNYEARLRCKDGSIRTVQINSNVFYRDGEFVHIRCFTTDITERKAAEMALNDLITGTAATIGEDFFPALVCHISTALAVPIALVTQFVDQELQSLAFVVDGKLQPNFTYDLPETPCIELVVDYSYHCPFGLSERFPNHPHRARAVESYLGVALRGRQGQVLGSLCIFDRQPLQDLERARQILNVFGSRAAAELERQRTENALQNLIEGTAALTGPDFFPALVQHIAIALRASHAFVTEVVDGGSRLHFLAAWADGRYLPNDTVDIAGTICSLVLQEGAYYCDRDVVARFPQNPRLARMGVESYQGIALQNRQGQKMGTLCIFSRQPIIDPERSKQIMQVFAARAAAELERQRAELVIKQQFAAIEAVIDGISILQNGIYLYVNQAHLHLFGYEHADELVGKSWKLLYSPDEVERFEQEIFPLLPHGQGWQGEAIATRKDGSTFAQGVSLTLTEDGLLISVCRDISDLKQAQALITHNALHDSLTGLPNRTLLLERLELAMQRAQRYEQDRYAVLFLDLDRFKMINDSLGHVVGDQLLVAIAQRLKIHLRQTDLVARLGGDEFLVLLEDISSSEEVAQIAERILADFQKPLAINGHQIFISTSIGIVLGQKDYQQATDLIRDADIAMYQAKNYGRSSYRFFDIEMHTEVLNRLTLETDLRKAVDRQEFTIYYQPIVELLNYQLIGFEALVRWQHPKQGLIMPDKFISIAEETGFIQFIDGWVLHHACQQVGNWQTQFPQFSSLKISINLSAQDLCKVNLIQEIDQILENTGLSGKSVTLEITESLLINDVEKIIILLKQLTTKQIRISIDDFGTGYSSLCYLHRLPFHSLKIDRSFVSQMEANKRNYKIASTIITLGQQLGLTTIAEGIETAQQLDLLQKLGCQFGQGYLFAKPLSAQDVEVYLLQGTGAARGPWEPLKLYSRGLKHQLDKRGSTR